ncbi:MAG TPA: PfkB family carbohydrate kinase [Terriglobales bacterium]|nr:PfkB family carbohydrate kinase [Terriglobales bacterium]
MRILSIGEVLWDVTGAAEYLGGAPLNFSAHARKLGHEVLLLSGVGDDERGRRALVGLGKCGLSSEFVDVVPGERTGTAEVELGPDGKPVFRIVRPAAYDFIRLTELHARRLVSLQPRWIYVGSLYHTSKRALEFTMKLLGDMPSARAFYDVNLRDGNWSLATVEQLASRASVIKLSDSEAEFLDASLNMDGDEASFEHFCRRWSDQYRCRTICVTFGERGCGIYTDGTYAEIPGCKVEVADTVGAGDAFSAGFVHGMEQGRDAYRCGAFANAVAAVVASRPGAIPDWSVEEVTAMLSRGDSERTPHTR